MSNESNSTEQIFEKGEHMSPVLSERSQLYYTKRINYYITKCGCVMSPEEAHEIVQRYIESQEITYGESGKT
jgi:hypothetical protein